MHVRNTCIYITLAIYLLSKADDIYSNFLFLQPFGQSNHLQFTISRKCVVDTTEIIILVIKCLASYINFTHILLSIMNWATHKHDDLHFLVAVLTMFQSQLYDNMIKKSAFSKAEEMVRLT